jgi:hypothetical protein
LISERVVAEDRYTSIHIEELVKDGVTPSCAEEISPRHPQPESNSNRTAWTSPASSTSVPGSLARRHAGKGHAQGRETSR